MGEPSRLVKRRGFWGLNFAAGCFGDGDNCPTLVIYAPRGKALGMVNLLTTGTDRAVVKELLEFGRGLVGADERVHSYVLWWDGFLTIGDRRTDAVFCEAGVRGEGSAFLFALRYVVNDGQLVKLGRPRLVGRVEPAFEAPVLFPPPWKSDKSKGRQKKPGPAPSRARARRT